MPLPDPVPGLVVRYSYLWHDEFRRGLEDGSKDRPCVVILSVVRADGETVVTVAPVTHTPPRLPAEAVELPPATKTRLGLDTTRSWLVVTEVNRFCWPGYDLRPIRLPGGTSYHYGILPPGLFRQVTAGLGAWARQERLQTTPR